MANNQSLLDVFERNKFDNNLSKKSKTWFEQQVLLLSKQKITPQQILKNDPTALKAQIMPGNLYMFLYDAKNKDTLEYWDRFPLVFPFRAVEGGFLGLNMHYLPYKLRATLMDRLLQFKSNNKFDETTKLRYSWSLIAGVSRFRMAEPCVKHYLKEHVKSPFVKVDASDWSTAMMLPVESFVGATKQQVWTESQRSIR